MAVDSTLFETLCNENPESAAQLQKVAKQQI